MKTQRSKRTRSGGAKSATGGTKQPTTRVERGAKRRKLQMLRAARRYKARRREALREQEQQRRMKKAGPLWRRPDPEPPEQRPQEPSQAEAPADQEDPLRSTVPEKPREAPYVRRAVRVRRREGTPLADARDTRSGRRRVRIGGEEYEVGGGSVLDWES